MHAKVWTAIIMIAVNTAAYTPTLVAAEDTIAQLDRPDPASISVPDMTFTPDAHDIRRYDTYFYFYKSSVTYETAFADLDQCRMYALSARLVAVPPKFVPLGADVVKEKRPLNNFYFQYGLVGGLMADIMIANAEDDARLATNRRCLAYKGYGRYGTSKAIWKQIDVGTDAEKLARIARLASGSQPQAGAVEP